MKLMIQMEIKLLVVFMKKNCRKLTKKEFRIEKVIKRKGNGRTIIIHLIARLRK